MKAIDFRKGYEICINHAIRLAHDADLLAENGSLGHAFFLYFTAMEEAVKSMFYALVHVGVLEYDEKVKRDMMKHMDKTAMFTGFLSSEMMKKQKDFDASVKVPTREEFTKSLAEIAEAISEFRRLRETSLYVDLKKNKWNNPMDFPEADFNSAREYILYFTSSVRQKFDILINIPKEKLEAFFRSMSPILVQGMLLLSEQMFDRGIIKEEEYKAARASIERKMREIKRGKRGYRIFWE